MSGSQSPSLPGRLKLHPEGSRRLVASLVLVVFSGCATAGARAGTQSAGNCSAEGATRCAALTELVDSAALASRLLRIDGPEGGPTVFSVRFGPDGRVEDIGTIFQGYPEDLSRPLQEALASSLLPQGVHDKSYGIALLVGGGAVPQLAVVQLGPRNRAPKLLNSHVLAAMARAALQGGRVPDGSQSAIVRGVVTSNGEFMRPVVLKSTGNPAVDWEAVRIASRARLRPGEIDGRPVQMTVNLPVTFGN